MATANVRGAGRVVICEREGTEITHMWWFDLAPGDVWAMRKYICTLAVHARSPARADAGHAVWTGVRVPHLSELPLRKHTIRIRHRAVQPLLGVGFGF